MSKLIPERRVDKNGVASTKWVLPSSVIATTSGTIPAPSITAAPSVRPLNLTKAKVNAVFKNSTLPTLGFKIRDFDRGALLAVE